MNLTIGHLLSRTIYSPFIPTTTTKKNNFPTVRSKLELLTLLVFEHISIYPSYLAMKTSLQL